jgi:predicted ATPase
MSFPVFLSSFIGRKNEATELISWWQAKSTRLLTLTGPGGSGKTRLAAEILPSLKNTFEDGLVWVELAGLSDPAALPQAVASEARP